jgi:hypothetical protein
VQTRTPLQLNLTDEDMQTLQHYADALCISIDEAATQLTRDSLHVNFDRRHGKPSAEVISFTGYERRRK